MIAYKLADLKKIYISYIAATLFIATVILFKKASQDTSQDTVFSNTLHGPEFHWHNLCNIFSKIIKFCAESWN